MLLKTTRKIWSFDCHGNAVKSTLLYFYRHQNILFSFFQMAQEVAIETTPLGLPPSVTLSHPPPRHPLQGWVGLFSPRILSLIFPSFFLRPPLKNWPPFPTRSSPASSAVLYQKWKLKMSSFILRNKSNVCFLPKMALSILQVKIGLMDFLISLYIEIQLAFHWTNIVSCLPVRKILWCQIHYWRKKHSKSILFNSPDRESIVIVIFFSWLIVALIFLNLCLYAERGSASFKRKLSWFPVDFFMNSCFLNLWLKLRWLIRSVRD